MFMSAIMIGSLALIITVAFAWITYQSRNRYNTAWYILAKRIGDGATTIYGPYVSEREAEEHREAILGIAGLTVADVDWKIFVREGR